MGWLIHVPHRDPKGTVKLDPMEWRCDEWTVLNPAMNEFECTEYKHKYPDEL